MYNNSACDEINQTRLSYHKFLLVLRYTIAKIKYLSRAHAQGVRQSVCPSIVVVVGTKIAISRLLGICACYKHNQSIDIGERWFICASNCSKRLTSAINGVFSVQYACGLSTTPTIGIILCSCDCVCSSSVLERVVKS